MKNIKIGRITLAVTFILLGVVISLDKFLHYRLIDLLSMLWPFIIIILGLEIIYRIVVTKKEIKLDWISTGLIILFVIIIGGSTTISRYYPNMKKMMNTMNNKYRYSEKILEEVVLDKNKKLIIDESNIDIVIDKSNYKNIKIILESIYKHNGDGKENFGDKLKLINIEDNGETTTISRCLKKKRKFRKMNVENKRYLVYLPSGTDLEVRSKHGNVSLALPREQAGKFNIIATYGRIYDGLEFNVIESASKVRINEFRKSMKPEFNIRVNDGDIILETN